MGYYISSMLGIRTGGVFSGETDIEDMRKRIAKIVLKMRKGDDPPDLGDEKGDVSHCMSKELEAHKGTYVVLAGVFNYWSFESVGKLAKLLSEEFGVEVMQMTWDEEQNIVQCQIWLAGNPLLEIVENPIGQIIRRIA